MAIFRFTAEQIHSLHDLLLITSYGLDGTFEVCALEKLRMFLHIMAENHQNRDTNNQCVQSNSTMSIHINQLLITMNVLTVNILKLVGPNFTNPNPQLMNEDWFKPFYQ